MARTNPFQFIQQVRAEAARIVWPTRRETGLTTVMVMIMATLFATFFFTVDLIVRFDESPKALADEVDRVVREAVELVWSRNQASLSGKRLNVLPASIAITDGVASELHGFRRAFWKAVEGAEKRLADAGTPDADPLDDTQPVDFAGQRFEGLLAAVRGGTWEPAPGDIVGGVTVPPAGASVEFREPSLKLDPWPITEEDFD